MKEVLRLVTGQIKASKKEVKAVIMVGGFGHNVYLWVAINYEVKELRWMSCNLPIGKATISFSHQSRG